MARRQRIVSQLTVIKSIGDDLCLELFEAGNIQKSDARYTCRHPYGEQKKGLL